MLSALVAAAALAATNRHTLDIVDYLSKREMIPADREDPVKCLVSPQTLDVAADRVDLITCGKAASKADEKVTYILVEKGKACWWGTDYEDVDNSTSTMCGRVFRFDEYPVQYDKTVLPTEPDSGEVTTVWLSATIIKLNSLDIKAQTYSYSMYFREEWFDRRLSWNPHDFDGQDSIDWSSTSTSSTDPFLWTPDGFFSTATTVSNPDSDESFSIRSDGYVLWSRLLQITSFCEMNLRYYPFDYQECITDVESYAYSNSSLGYTMSTNTSAIDLDPNIDTACSVCSVNTVNAYKLDAPSATRVQKEYRGVIFSGVRWVFPFSRSTATYFITMFLPLWLICILSAGSCWIDNGAAVARVGMGITTVLVLISQMNGLKTNIATVRYITSIDVYLLLCLVFTVINVVEFGAVNYLANKLKSREEGMKMKQKFIMQKMDSKIMRRMGSISPSEDRGSEDASGDEEAGNSNEPVSNTKVHAKAEDILSPAENAYLRECFDKFAKEEDKISIQHLKPLLHSMGIPDERIVELMADVRSTGSIGYNKLAREIKKFEIFEEYGVKATSVGSIGITMSSLVWFESWYRVASLLALVVFNVVWFIVVLVMSDDGKSDQ